jgi:hypothetical protein
MTNELLVKYYIKLDKYFNYMKYLKDLFYIYIV